MKAPEQQRRHLAFKKWDRFDKYRRLDVGAMRKLVKQLEWNVHLNKHVVHEARV
jgi:hypothetical protein